MKALKIDLRRLVMENLKNLQLKITELMEDKSSLEKENAQLRQKIVELEKENEKVKTLVNVELLDNDIKKIILKNYARNKSSLSIYREVGKLYGLTIEEIDEIIKNIDKLDKELIEFYKKEVEFFRENDLIKFFSEQDLIKDSIDVTLSSLDMQILEYSKLKTMDKDEFKIYSDLLARKKDFINIRLKLVDTYREGTLISDSNKENSNNISIEIKKQINNIMNIDTFKQNGISTEVVRIDKEVEQWE
jgi:FtsZ-binding cell division protein ZapB